MNLKYYKVIVTRIGYAQKEIEVEAYNQKMAEREALKEAPGLEFLEHDAKYKVEKCGEIT